MLISCMYKDHITFVTINTHTKRRSWTIARMANVMLIHCEFFTNISIVEEHDIGLHNCQSTLWPKSLCQSFTSVDTKYCQGGANAIPIHNQCFKSSPNTFGDVFLIQLFLIFNECGYTFNNFRPIPHDSGFARLWIPIQEHIFSILVLMPQHYIILQAPIRGCAQKLELHGGDIIIPHVEAELLCYGMSN